MLEELGGGEVFCKCVNLYVYLPKGTFLDKNIHSISYVIIA